MANTIRLKRGTTEPTSGVLVTGELAINTGDGNVYTKLDDGSVTNIVAKSQKLTASVRNETGSTIAAFKAVYISGASSNKALVSLAQANSEATSSKTFGVTTTSIATGNNGEVVCVGLLEKVDTSAYTAGTQLWLSPTSAGGFVTTAPSSPNHAVFIGTVTYSHANNGKVEIRIQNGYELQELHNVSITSVADKDIIAYNSTTGLYENRTATALGLAPLASPTFTGDVTASQNLVSNFSSGDEGGEIKLATAQTNSVLIGGSVTIDINQSQIRFFETGGTNRGAYINLASAASGVGTNLLAGGGGSSTWGSITGTLSSQTDLNTALGLKAPLASPTFTGTVTIPAGASISGYATLASPTFTGTPVAPTATAGTNTTQVATTAFVTTAVSTKANLASPTFTGTPAAPTPTTATNSTQIATTAYVKSNLASYATLASPVLTGNPQAPTQSTATESNYIASTSFVKNNIRRPAQTFSGNLIDIGGLNENVSYHSTSNAAHNIALWYAGYFNAAGAVIMFKQSDDSQMNFNDTTGYTKAPNGDRWYAAFPNAVVFAVKVSTQDWFIFGDLTATQYTPYGTYISGPTIDTNNTVYSGYMDYYGNNVNAYTAYNTVHNGWGGQTNVSTSPSQGTVMSDNFTYSNSTDTYNLLADGSGGYTLNFVSSSGGGYDPYGTKVGTPFWNSSQNSLYQTIADGNGGTTDITWDGNPPYPVYGVQVSTTSTSLSGYKSDAIGASYYVYYDETYYADGNGGSYASWTLSSGQYYPSGWATTNYAFNTGVPNTYYTYYDENGSTVNPWTWGYNAADGMGNTYFNASGTPPYGEPASYYFTDNSYNYGRIYADGNGGFYFAS